MNSMMQHIGGLKIVSQPHFVTGSPTIGTHDGSFHCDEALAISMLSLLPEFQTATILRTRNPDYLAQCDIVVDVGAIFDSSTHRYDHHQRDFTGTFSDAHKIKLSSAGLVYKHFGKRIIHSVLSGICSDVFGDELVGICYLKIYESFIQHIDGIDNGVEVSDGELNYDISTTLSARVGRLNPAWNEDQSASVTNSQFSKAMILTGSEFVDHVTDLVQRWWPARAGVIKGINSRLHVHPSGSLVVFDNACPWQSHLFDVEKEMQISPILYVIFPDSGGSWRIQAVPQSLGSFHSRKKLPEAWNGLRDDVLSETIGIDGCIFVHATGFIGGAKTKESVLAMAIKALDTV